MGSNKNYLCYKTRSRALREGSGRFFFFESQKLELTIEGSQHRFFIDFGRVSGGPGTSKMRFSLRSGSDFYIFSYLKISTLLKVQKHRFWPRFGGQVGTRKRTCWPQEANMSEDGEFFWWSKKHLNLRSPQKKKNGGGALSENLS